MSNSDIAAALARWMATTIDGENKHEWHRDMHAAIVALRAAQEWQDISAAPKDGTEFLAVTSTRNCWIVLWDNEKWKDVWSRDPIGLLTHWRPLPNPPVAVTAGKLGTE